MMSDFRGAGGSKMTPQKNITEGKYRIKGEGGVKNAPPPPKKKNKKKESKIIFFEGGWGILLDCRRLLTGGG